MENRAWVTLQLKKLPLNSDDTERDKQENTVPWCLCDKEYKKLQNVYFIKAGE